MSTVRALALLGLVAVTHDAARIAAKALRLQRLRARMPELFDGSAAALSVLTAIEQTAAEMGS